MNHVIRAAVLTALAAALTSGLAGAADDMPRKANFEGERASAEARHVANWVMHSGDNNVGDHRRMPFIVVDKVDAKVFVFDSRGELVGAAPALLGLAKGDVATPGIGERELANIPPHERVTPAGRFVAALGDSTRKEDVLWVDYEGGVSMHRVINTKPAERRPHRLATPTPLDNRISYGCINIPKKFYESVVQPTFKATRGIVYVLPETRPARELFASYDVNDPARGGD